MADEGDDDLNLGGAEGVENEQDPPTEEEDDSDEVAADLRALMNDEINRRIQAAWQSVVRRGGAEGNQAASVHSSSGGVEWQMVEIPDEEVASEQILYPKHQRGEQGSKQRAETLKAFMQTGQDQKLVIGAPGHMVSGFHDEEGNETNQKRYIQDSLIKNDSTKKKLLEHLKNFEVDHILEIPIVANRFGETAEEIYAADGESTNLLSSHFKMTETDVKFYQATLNHRGKYEDRSSSGWLLAYLKKICTQEMKDRVDVNFSKLKPDEKGGVTYLYYILKILYKLTRETIASLNVWLKRAERKGLTMYVGESPVKFQKEAVAVCTALANANALSFESEVDILTGLTHCGNKEFAETFKFMLQARNMVSLNLDDDDDDNEAQEAATTLRNIEQILAKGVDKYNSLAIAGKWHVSNRQFANPCWNCDDIEHGVRDCPKPKNQDKIQANKKQWEENRSRNNNNTGRKKWTQPGRNTNNNNTNFPAPRNGEVRLVGGEHRIYCGVVGGNGKACGWGDHGNKYHNMKVELGNAFNLADVSPNHHLLSKQGKAANQNSGGGAGTGTKSKKFAGANQIVLDKDKAQELVTNFERNTSSADSAEFAGVLRGLLSLN